LERFPLIHSDHHNNKSNFIYKNSFEDCERVEFCIDDFLLLMKILEPRATGISDPKQPNPNLYLHSFPQPEISDWDFSLGRKTSRVRQQSRTPLTALRSQGNNDSTRNRPRGLSIDGIQRFQIRASE
jgi:hypothetical protein